MLISNGSTKLPAGSASTAYDSFGNTTNASFPSRYQFTGREFDNFSSLQYSRARFYDPNLGRFISQDPIGFAGGDINLYGYVRNDPIFYRDPSGKIIPLVVAGVVIGAGVGTALYRFLTPECQRTGWGYAGAAVGGGITGGIGVVAAPIAGAAGLGTGLGGAALVNGAAGVVGAGASAAIDPNQDFTPVYAASSGLFGAAGGYGASRVFRTPGMSNFRQVGFPRTVPGVIPEAFGGSAGSNAMRSLYYGGVPSNVIGQAGPTAVTQLTNPSSCECR